MVTSVERGRAVDVSSDEGRLLFPHSVIPHPPDTTLIMVEKKARDKEKENEVEVVWVKIQRSSNNEENRNKGKEEEQWMK